VRAFEVIRTPGAAILRKDPLGGRAAKIGATSAREGY